ncbi:hypothetical protein CY34DRAFT_95852, partial [Suillus luteus UH-Slu-Lm8-n1]
MVKEQSEHARESQPFVTQVILYGPGATTSSFHANVDDSAMVNVIDLKAFNKAARHLKKLTCSTRILRMADGSEVLSQGIWTGTIQWNKAKIRTSFEVLDSGGIWSMLIGKPLLEQLEAMHNYAADTITI